MNKKNLLTALKNLVLFSGVVHMIIVTIYSIINTEIRRFNFFDIIDLDLFFPNIVTGATSQLLSVCIGILIVTIFYFMAAKQKE